MLTAKPGQYSLEGNARLTEGGRAGSSNVGSTSPLAGNRQHGTTCGQLTTLKDTAGREHHAVSRTYRPGWIAAQVELVWWSRRTWHDGADGEYDVAAYGVIIVSMSSIPGGGDGDDGAVVDDGYGGGDADAGVDVGTDDDADADGDADDDADSAADADDDDDADG